MRIVCTVISVIIAIIMLLSACSRAPQSETPQSGDRSVPAGESGIVSDFSSSTADDFADDSKTATGDFTVAFSGEGAECLQSGSVYTVVSAGEYTFSGALQGQIVVAAPEDAEVKLVFAGVSVSCADSAPVLIISASEVTIKSEEGTYNTVSDLRTGSAASAAETEENYDAAIYSACDLKITGKGTLIVTSSYDNGVKSKDDLSVKNVSLKVTCPGNALKGNDSVEIESGTLILVSTSSDGIKTSNSDISSKGNRRGNVVISGGSVDIYAACDGVSAAYDVIINDSEGECTVNVFTGSYAGDRANVSSGNVSGKTSYSSKGIKAQNDITVSGGTVAVKSTDDGLHANSGETLDDGSKSTGNITVEGGRISVTAADDGFHADGSININGGTVIVSRSYEGLEANVVNINGGYVSVYGRDDGINACSGGSIPLVNITGGYLEVTTPSGDTDAIDSNGSFAMSGGIAIIKGGTQSGSVAGSVDVDRTLTVTGGTVIALGGICETPTADKVCVYISQNTSFASGSYALKDSSGETIAEFTLSSTYSSVWVASDKIAVGESYSFVKDGDSVLDWEQTSSQVGSGGGGFNPGRPGGGRR
ncbi:MAG: carbohydrate-binding domain-containing protein [Clostridia bacterium]|nr:carbohydrate-binding domain-containing protein [Clostridia bacterium]